MDKDIGRDTQEFFAAFVIACAALFGAGPNWARIRLCFLMLITSGLPKETLLAESRDRQERVIP